jgi:hypothetical protein
MVRNCVRQSVRKLDEATRPPSIALADLLEKGADADLLRQMIQHVAQRMMEMDAEGICAAAYGERSPERQNSRNGYRERLWQTRAGAVDLKIPKLRSGSYFPGFLEPRRTGEKALAAVIQEAYPRRLDPFGGRVGPGDGHERDFQEPGQPPVRRDRRAGACVPRPPDRRAFVGNRAIVLHSSTRCPSS